MRTSSSLSRTNLSYQMKITRNVTCPSLGKNYGGIQLGLSYHNEFISHVKILHSTDGIWELGIDKMTRLLAYFSNRKKIVQIGVTRQGEHYISITSKSELAKLGHFWDCINLCL